MNLTTVMNRRVAALAFCFAGCSSSALALNVQPLVMDMVSVGPHARGVIQVINDGASPVPVEVVANKLDIAIDGKTSTSPAANEFVVFPPQAVLQPGATQSFRVQWVGEPDLKKSQSYIISVNQLPVKRTAGDSGVQMVFNFGVITNVAPSGAQSVLKLSKAEPTTNGGKQAVAVTVENPSVMYAYFSDAKLSMESGSWRKSLSPSQLKDAIGYGVVLPGKSRRFLIPIETLPAGAKVTATLAYSPMKAK